MSKNHDFLYYYGIHATLALFEKRKESIQKVYLKKELIPSFSALLKWCAKEKKPYQVVQDQDLEKLTDSTHHEGICLVAQKKFNLSEAQFLQLLSAGSSQLIVALDHVENPHNLGAIIRTLCHFGVLYLLTDSSISLSPSCCRIAQGGAEFIQLIQVQDLSNTLSQLNQLGFETVATSSHEGTPLHRFSFQNKTILVFGSESHGIRKKIFDQVKKTVTIQGTGKIESLNVSQAAALCCYAFSIYHE